MKKMLPARPNRSACQVVTESRGLSHLTQGGHQMPRTQQRLQRVPLPLQLEAHDGNVQIPGLPLQPLAALQEFVDVDAARAVHVQEQEEHAGVADVQLERAEVGDHAGVVQVLLELVHGDGPRVVVVHLFEDLFHFPRVAGLAAELLSDDGVAVLTRGADSALDEDADHHVCNRKEGKGDVHHEQGAMEGREGAHRVVELRPVTAPRHRHEERDHRAAQGPEVPLQGVRVGRAVGADGEVRGDPGGDRDAEHVEEHGEHHGAPHEGLQTSQYGVDHEPELVEEGHHADDAHHADDPDDAEYPQHRDACELVARHNHVRYGLHDAHKDDERVEKIPGSVVRPEEAGEAVTGPPQRQFDDEEQAEHGLDDGVEGRRLRIAPLSQRNVRCHHVGHRIHLQAHDHCVHQDQQDAGPLESLVRRDAIEQRLRLHHLRLRVHEEALLRRPLPAPALPRHVAARAAPERLRLPPGQGRDLDGGRRVAGLAGVRVGARLAGLQ
mmetsp:Transcript_60831/g.177797  ORF Transcript_60831/g.177797 Transcript_60831/m.177797 type:complete len:495 (+) Transcript_60831:90-1574(+)